VGHVSSDHGEHIVVISTGAELDEQSAAMGEVTPQPAEL
jgi:hypothetical protein